MNITPIKYHFFPEVISNTDMTSWSMCEYRWFLERCCNFVPIKETAEVNPDLLAGGVFAAGLNLARKSFFEENKSEYDAIMLAENYVMDELSKVDYDDPLKTPARMSSAINEYFDEFPLDSEDKPVYLSNGQLAGEQSITIELPFEHPITKKKLIFKGKLDSLISRYGKVHVIDDKTTKRIYKDEAARCSVDSQFMGYAYLAKTLGLECNDVLVRKVGLYKGGNRFEEIAITVSEYLQDEWYEGLLRKVKAMLDCYENYKITKNERNFSKDFKLGCTAFNRICPFSEPCRDPDYRPLLFSEFDQIIYDRRDENNKKMVPLKEFLGEVLNEK